MIRVSPAAACSFTVSAGITTSATSSCVAGEPISRNFTGRASVAMAMACDATCSGSACGSATAPPSKGSPVGDLRSRATAAASNESFTLPGAVEGSRASARMAPSRRRDLGRPRRRRRIRDEAARRRAAPVQGTLPGQEVILVALLTGSAEDPRVQARLASALGVTAYEARLALAAGFPTILLTTPDGALRAEAIAASLRAEGDDAVACDADTVVPAESMVPLDRFVLDPAGVVAGEQPPPYRSAAGAGELVAGDRSLPYGDILCLLRAIHRGRVATETRSTERRFDVGKSLLSGGLANTKTVTKTASEATESREPVLYVFRRSGETPWLLRERARTTRASALPAG